MLQEDNHTPLDRIGALVHLSASSVQRRIRRMESTGVIRSNVAVLDPAAVGRPITLIVGVQIDNERADHLDRTIAELASAPEVQQCYYVTGDVDFIVVLTATDMSEYESISRRLFRENVNIKHFRSYVVMKVAKAGLEVPIA